MRLVALLALAVSILPRAGAAGDPEDELKAAIVLSFLRYGEWPKQAGTSSPLTVGVYGRPSFADVLRQTFAGKAVEDRPVRLIELKNPADGAACQIVYFATIARDAEIKSVVQSQQYSHVLTIGEDKDFLNIGGAVNLLVVDGRMTFEVSLSALERNGVNISSRLLRFGQIRNTKKGARS